MITKPMLAGTLKDIKDIKYPVLVTPKLDGIRCLKINGKAVSRNFKPIPNKYMRSWIEKYFPDGVDGELLIQGKPFQETTSAVMSEDGEPNVVYCIFDYIKDDIKKPYTDRMDDLAFVNPKIPDRSPTKKYFIKVYPVQINNENELLQKEKDYLACGYEGIMIRSIDSPYKCGRSTLKEGYLLKLKRFKDEEAIIVGFEERMHNTNEAKKDALGYTERSTHKANMIPTGILGAFKVKCKKFKNEFSIGTGMNDAQRKAFWNGREKLLGKLLKFKYQDSGMKDVPRFPVFLGIRHENDT